MAYYNKILAFINNFKSLHKEAIEDSFLHGNCFWFAHILKIRFKAKIFYMPRSNHFVALIRNKYFDISGEVKDIQEPIYDWSSYKYMDELDYRRVMKYCIFKDEN